MSTTASSHPVPQALGVLGSSRKPDEHRVPIHPAQLETIAPQLRERIILESGYGRRFGYSDQQLRPLVADVTGRAGVIADADTVLLAKPQVEDLTRLRDGQTLWGWPHCVQDRALTQKAIDKHLTLIAFEAMFHPTRDGGQGLHVFHQNNELAGYASVQHAMTLMGTTGAYGRRPRAIVIGFGSTARGAIAALVGQGVRDIQVLTRRGPGAVAAPIHEARLVHYSSEDGARIRTIDLEDRGTVEMASYLAESDIVVNCTLQDPNAPVTYLREDDLDEFRPGSLIVDVSCDESMGFEWARPTSFADPVLTVGPHVTYYAVDHSPSYLWDSASWEISRALVPFLPTVMAGPEAWAHSETITHAIEIREGVVCNPAILTFQRRAAEYPHPVARTGAPGATGGGAVPRPHEQHPSEPRPRQQRPSEPRAAGTRPAPKDPGVRTAGSARPSAGTPRRRHR
jgi:alanine dehydrogenase